MSEVKAYVVKEDYEAQCCIVFATSSAAARRLGAGELCTEWEGIEYCRRAPWADQYAGHYGGVPWQALLDQGWTIPCSVTGIMFDEDMIEDPESPECSPVFVGGWVYLNADIHDTEVASMKAQHELECAVRSEAIEKFPGSEVVWFFTGRGVDNIPGVDLKIPGLQGRVTWQRGQETVMVERRDLEPWSEYKASISGAAA